MWTLVYYQHMSKYEYKSETKEDALDFGCYSTDNGLLSMKQLIDPNGNVNMDEEQLRDYYTNEHEPI